MASKKGKKKGAASGAKKKSNDVPSPAGPALRLTLTASPDFHEATASMDSGAVPVPESSEGDLPQGGIVLQMVGWDKLENVVAWFSKGVEADKNAQLKFSPLLTKEQRAVIHGLADSKASGLADGCSSRGWGEERYIILHHPTMKDALGKIVLTEDQEVKAHSLWRWAVDAGIQCSRDEIKERVSANAFTPELVELWKRKSAEQRAVEALNTAVQRNDEAAVRSLVAEHPSVVSSGVTAVLTGCAPLHSAAALGHVNLINLLLQHGAPLEGEDGHGLTALQVARKEEQCDAEGALLQAGAKDNDADKWPGAAAAPARQPKAEGNPAPSTTNGSSATSDGTGPGKAAESKQASAPTSTRAASGGGPDSAAGSEPSGRAGTEDVADAKDVKDVKGGLGKLPPRTTSANKSSGSVSSKSAAASGSRTDGLERGKASSSSSDTRVVTTSEIEPAAPLTTSSHQQWLDRSRYPVRTEDETGDDAEEQDYVSELWARVSDFCAEHKEAVWAVSLTAIAALGVGVFALRRQYQ